MLSHCYKDREDVRAIVLLASWATVVMTPRPFDKAYEVAGSVLGLPSETQHTVVDWGSGGGS